MVEDSHCSLGHNSSPEYPYQTPGAFASQGTNVPFSSSEQFSHRVVSCLRALDFLSLYAWRVLLDQLATGTPHLDQVILGSTDHNPRIVPVP
jgi:hypothetical protein